MFWLRSKNLPHEDSQISESFDIPKNPVFYPPTPNRTQSVGVVCDEQQSQNNKLRPRRLLSRFKNILMFRTSAQSMASETAFLGDVPEDFDEQSKERNAFRRSRLVARSPLREDYVSTNLRELVSTSCFSDDANFCDQKSATLSSNVSYMPYSPTIIHIEPNRSDPDLSIASRQHDESESYEPSVFFGESITSNRIRGSMIAHYGTCRIRSMFVSSLYSIQSLAQPYESPDDRTRRCRISRESDTTAIPEADVESDAEDCDLPEKLGFETIATECYTVLDGETDDTPVQSVHTVEECKKPNYIEQDSFMLDGHEYAVDDGDESEKTVRRPHSEDFIERARLISDILGTYGRFDIYEKMGSADHRGMYIRNSCADTSLVKSTFDLAKMLPSTPQ